LTPALAGFGSVKLFISGGDQERVGLFGLFRFALRNFPYMGFTLKPKNNSAFGFSYGPTLLSICADREMSRVAVWKFSCLLLPVRHFPKKAKRNVY
jgi:hypothetical protein